MQFDRGSVTTQMTICVVVFLIGNLHALTQSLKLFPMVLQLYILSTEY